MESKVAPQVKALTYSAAKLSVHSADQYVPIPLPRVCRKLRVRATKKR
jgi:hypothetical protein